VELDSIHECVVVDRAGVGSAAAKSFAIDFA
jgi:hypothetical protein